MVNSFSDPGAGAFRAEVRVWVKGALTPELKGVSELVEDEQTELRRAWGRMLYEAGYAGLSWPKEFGGRGEGIVLETILFEELAAAGAPEGLGRIGRVMVGPIIMAEGTKEQQAKYLPGILSGKEIWCLGFSEPEAGSDLPAIKTRVRREGSGYLVKGRKIWTSHAHHADRCLLLTRSSPDKPSHDGMTMLLIDMHQPGVIVSPIITAAGDHHFNEVLFEDAYVSDEDRLGAEDDGWRVFRACLSFERGGAVALNHYLDMRRQCDVLLECCARESALPGAPKRAKSLSTAVELVRWHVMRVCEMEAQGQPSRSTQNVLKLYFSELWQQLTNFGLGCGCAEHRQFWQYQYLRSRAGTIYAGTSEIQRSMIARRLDAGGAGL